jgi:hypothetical protein
MSSSLFSGGGTVPVPFSVSPVSAILDLRGNGQAHWNGTQIEASGSDYTLGFALTYLQAHPTVISSSITVKDGTIVNVLKHSGSPFNLPEIGSPGIFVISAPVNRVSYDLSSMANDGPIQRLSVSARAETFLIGSEVPEPNSAIPLAFSCLVLIFAKSRKVWRRYVPEI